MKLKSSSVISLHDLARIKNTIATKSFSRVESIKGLKAEVIIICQYIVRRYMWQNDNLRKEGGEYL